MTAPTAPPSAPTPWRQRLRALPGLLAGAPWWVAAVVGVVLIGLGAVLVVRPLSALGVLTTYVGVSALASGIADLLGSDPGDEPRTAALPATTPATRALVRVGAWLWIALGLLVLVWLGRNVGLLVPVLAVALLVSGVTSLIRAAVRRTLASLPTAVLGLAEIALGVLALRWPDLTLLVLGALFGARTALFGLTLLVRGITARLRGASTRRRTPGTAVRLVGAVAVLLLAGAGIAVSAQLRSGPTTADPFYDVPADLPEEPGVLLRWEDYPGATPEGTAGYRLLYTTSDATGRVIAASGVLAVPTDVTGPAPLITWAHGTVGVAQACAPSLGDNAFDASGTAGTAQLADLGWAMVATDYPGMGVAGAFPYLIGEGEGRAVLDAARAARQVPTTTTLSDQTAIWGHSQGGHAALWAGQLAGTYAPDLEIVGTAALSPASDPKALATAVASHPSALGSTLAIAYVVHSYTEYYPDVTLDDAVVPAARTLVTEAASRCTSDPDTLVTVLTGLGVSLDRPILRTGALDGPVGDLLDANTATGPFSAPLFVGQGTADEVVPYATNEAYLAQRCADGVDLEAHGYPDGTHMSVLAPGAAMVEDLITWTADRFAGAPTHPTC